MRLLPLKNTVVCLSSFGDNLEYLIQEKRMRLYDEIIIYTDRTFNFTKFSNVTVRNHSNFNFKELYEISRTKNIIMDNYFPVQGAMHGLKPYVNTFQTWHAVGAIKAFGVNDKTLNKRPKCAKERFRKSYQNIEYYLSGSKKMSTIFKYSFDIDNEKIVKSGMPRIDFYWNHSAIERAKQKLMNEFSMLNNKTIITYAPTYQENEFNIQNIKLDLNKIISELSEEYVIILRLHPTVSLKQTDLPNQVINMSSHHRLEDILSITDILITDYSSVAFEFANLERPIIFYPHNLNKYQQERGLSDSYKNLVTSNIANSTHDIIKYIKNNSFDTKEMHQFKLLWNEYSNGNNTHILSRMLK